MSTSSSSFAHREIYRGWSLSIVHTERTGSPLMESEFLVWIGDELIYDELESLEDAILRGKAYIDSLCNI
jgi:hypothetical protein